MSFVTLFSLMSEVFICIEIKSHLAIKFDPLLILRVEAILLAIREHLEQLCSLWHWPHLNSAGICPQQCLEQSSFTLFLTPDRYFLNRSCVWSRHKIQFWIFLPHNSLSSTPETMCLTIIRSCVFFMQHYNCIFEIKILLQPFLLVGKVRLRIARSLRL